MMMQQLVLSLFPGIGLLDRAFEEEGFCVVRGPDVLWGGDVHRFHPPHERFDGVIGGPPCIGESKLANLNGRPGYSLRDEFCRVVEEACSAWWLMEAVKKHDDLPLEGMVFPLQNRWLGEDQSRKRFFHSNLNLAPHIQLVALESATYKYAVLAGHGGGEGTVYRRMATYSWPEMCKLQGLPEDYELPGFARVAKRRAVGNGVPLAMGRAIAKAVKGAILQAGREERR